MGLRREQSGMGKTISLKLPLRSRKAAQDHLRTTQQREQRTVFHRRLAHAALRQGIREGGTEILFEALSERGSAKYLLNGAWVEFMTFPTEVYQGVTAVLKEAAGLDASETRRRQDGLVLYPMERFLEPPEEPEYDAHVSFLPTRCGEAIGVRLSPKSDPPSLPKW